MVMTEIKQAAGMLTPYIESVLSYLAESYGETTLEAAEHIQSLIDAGVSRRVEYASLFDQAMACPPLMRDLVSGMPNTEVAAKWESSEPSVRRARQKASGSGMQ
jgi:hypothetical protein